ncbi:MAG: CRISPR system precrRNA processing endoribonuclease RAMP protein Cas6 [Anaerolineae bacterium]
MDTMADEPTLFSVVLICSPTQEVEVEATLGHRAHAAFLDAVRRADPRLSAALHDPQVPIRPFTISPLGAVPPAQDGRVRLRPDRGYWLRITVLYAPLFRRLMERFLEADDRPVLRLGPAEMVVREVRTTPGSHLWSGCTSWAGLVRGARPEAEITLQFVSPTAFSFGQKGWGKKIVVLPQPELVFGSLLRVWNGLAPPPLWLEEKGLRAYLEEHVVVRQINLQTRMLRLRGLPQVGFVGTVTYGLMEENEVARLGLNLLADFAFYAGVGMKTTMGMGQCVRRNGPEAKA